MLWRHLCTKRKWDGAMRDALKKIKRVVVKAGTSILTGKQGAFSKSRLQRLGGDVLKVVEQNLDVVLVSSGAIALGMEAGGHKMRPKKMAELQACAAIGQGKMMHAYEQYFSRYGMHTAQVLLTRDGLESRERFLRARNTLLKLMSYKDDKDRMTVLPIVNENDTVATEEIAFGDNDILAVHVAHLIKADLLIILSDVDGFYLKDGSRLRQVSSSKEIDGELVKHLRDTTKQKTVGGMRAKLAAARVSMRLGIPLLIVSGHDKSVLAQALEGQDVGTLFSARNEKPSARKQWLAFAAPRRGIIRVDAGAFSALQSSKRSLLPSGMTGVKGSFDKGQVVELENSRGEVFGRGIVRYSSRELAQLIGKKTDEIQALLGYKSGDEVIHRNDLVIWD